jgi:hypothetical protein
MILRTFEGGFSFIMQRFGSRQLPLTAIGGLKSNSLGKKISLIVQELFHMCGAGHVMAL